MAAQLARWAIFASLFLAPLACEDTGPSATRASLTPERQFILTDLRLEERRNGRVLWSGTGSQADGDLSVADVTHLHLVRRAQEPNDTEFTLEAPRSHLAFDEGTALFDSVRVTEPSGSVLTAQRTDYNEKAGTLVGAGPLHFTTPTLVARATSGVVWLNEGMVEITGPVEGRYTKFIP